MCQRWLITAVVTLAAGAVSAADLTSSARSPSHLSQAEAYSWTGFYAGANAGGVWAGKDSANNNSMLPFWDPNGTGVRFMLGGPSTNNVGVGGGGQVGFNYKMEPSIIVGVEADIQGSAIGAGSSSPNLTRYAIAPNNPFGSAFLIPVPPVGASLPWYGTLRGRVGYLITPSLLVYGTAGVAFGGVHAAGLNSFEIGWSVGGGIEWMFMPHWSAKLEYLSVNLGDRGIVGNSISYRTLYHQTPQVDVVRVGVNYHFNLDAAEFARPTDDSSRANSRASRPARRPPSNQFFEYYPVLEPCEGHCAVSIFGGPSLETPLGHVVGFAGFVAPTRWQLGNATFVGAAISRRVATIAGVIDIEPELGVGKRLGIAHETEMWAALYVRYTAFPWNNFVRTTIGIDTGLSFATGAPFYEVQKSGMYHGSRVLHYLGPEITFAPPDRDDIEGFFRIHHRSGASTIFGPLSIFNGANGGVQFLTAGVRVRY